MSTRKSTNPLDQDCFYEFRQTYKEEMIHILYKIFQNTEKKKCYPTHFEANVTMIQKNLSIKVQGKKIVSYLIYENKSKNFKEINKPYTEMLWGELPILCSSGFIPRRQNKSVIENLLI